MKAKNDHRLCKFSNLSEWREKAWIRASMGRPFFTFIYNRSSNMNYFIYTPHHDIYSYDKLKWKKYNADISYVLPGKWSQLPSRNPCGRYFTESRPVLLLLCLIKFLPINIEIRIQTLNGLNKYFVYNLMNELVGAQNLTIFAVFIVRDCVDKLVSVKKKKTEPTCSCKPSAGDG